MPNTHPLAILSSHREHHNGGLLEGTGFWVRVEDAGGCDLDSIGIEDSTFEVY